MKKTRNCRNALLLIKNSLLGKFPQRSWQEWVSSLPVFLLLMIIIFAGNGEKIHAQLLKAGGGSIWQDYFALRGDIPIPDCNENLARVTPNAIVFRSLETSVEAISIFAFEKNRFILALMVFICAINLYQLAKPRQGIKPGGKLLNALSAIPLYIIMAIGAGGYFVLVEGNAAGLAIFFSLLFDQANLFLNIGLYIWVGMLLTQTCLGELVFYILRPWHMSPELLAFVAIVIMAVPTAYTGASGIIIAMGVTVYKELRLPDAFKSSLKMLANLLPYAAITLSIILGYIYLLNAYLDEFSAPIKYYRPTDFICCVSLLVTALKRSYFRTNTSTDCHTIQNRKNQQKYRVKSS